MSLQTVEELCLRFGLTQNMREEAIQKWRETSSNTCFISTSKQTKTILSAICVYITLLQYNKPLTITQVCNSIGCIGNEFGKVLSQVMKRFPLYKTESIRIEDLVGVTLSEAEFDENEREALYERVIDIIRISRECWLIEGRSPVHIIFGSAYLAWKSFKPNIRSKVKLTHFCNIVKIDYKHTTSQRVTEIFNALKTLASKIPGRQNLIFTKQNIAIYLNDILKYRNSLLYDLNQQINGKSQHNQSSNNSFEWMNAFKRKSYHESKPSDNGTNVEVKNESEEEISDSEIDSYIRSKTEVKIMKKLKKMVEKEDNEEEAQELLKIENFVKVEETEY